jgi:hemolysin activation/secretion protein
MAGFCAGFGVVARVTGAVALAAATLATTGPAAAQVAPRVALPTRQELDPARAAPIPAAPRRDLFKGIEAAPCAFRDSPLKVTLSAVEFRGTADGALALSDGELGATYAEFLGREAPLSVVCDIRDRAAALYLRRGILASVVIPEQQISEGRLTLTVVEARIASISYHGDAGPGQKQVERFLEHLRGLAPFDLDVAQRYLLLASDVPGVVVQAVLKPSPEGDGAIDLDVALSRHAVDGSLSLDNYGARSLGRELALARVDLNSFTSLGERLSIVGYGTPFCIEQRLLLAAGRYSIGGLGLAADLSTAWGWTRPGDTLKPLGLEGTSFAASARLTYPLIRHGQRNLNLSAGLDWIDQKVDFGGGLATLTDDSLRVLFVRLDGHYAPPELADHSVAVTGSIELRQGLSGLGASDFGDPAASRPLAEPDATVLRAEGQIGGGVGPLIGKAIVVWQHTDDPLLSYEEYSVGNLTVGRGYDPSVASGDRALSASLELSTVPLPLAKGAAWRPYAFYDATELTNLGLGAGTLDLASIGAGLRAQVAPGFALDLAWAKPLDNPFGVGGRPPARVLLSLSANLF